MPSNHMEIEDRDSPKVKWDVIWVKAMASAGFGSGPVADDEVPTGDSSSARISLDPVGGTFGPGRCIPGRYVAELLHQEVEVAPAQPAAARNWRCSASLSGRGDLDSASARTWSTLPQISQR